MTMVNGSAEGTAVSASLPASISDEATALPRFVPAVVLRLFFRGSPKYGLPGTSYY